MAAAAILNLLSVSILATWFTYGSGGLHLCKSLQIYLNQRLSYYVFVKKKYKMANAAI